MESNSKLATSEPQSLKTRVDECLEAEYIGGLIHEGFYDQLVIIGFPYDQGSRLCSLKGGQDYGPDSFRRFVVDIGSVENPEYDINIAKGLPKISDYGNIQVPRQPREPPKMPELYDKLRVKVGLCIQRKKLPFIIGGTRDLCQSIIQAAVEQKQEKQSLFIFFRQDIDLSQLSGLPTGEQINQKNSLTYYLQTIPKESKVMIIGVDKVYQKDIIALKDINPNCTVISAADIKSRQTAMSDQPSRWECLTKGGQLFMEILESANKDDTISQIIISISMECIEGMMGVSTRCHQGMSSEEAIEICRTASYLSSKLVALDICDYNPFVEDWSTGRMTATMFYYMCLGLSARQQGL